jgi:hypothetical protein
MAPYSRDTVYVFCNVYRFRHGALEWNHLRRTVDHISNFGEVRVSDREVRRILLLVTFVVSLFVFLPLQPIVVVFSRAW